VKRVLNFLLFFAIGCATGIAAQKIIEFKDYPATKTYNGTPALVDLKSHPQARMYRTELRSQTKKGANFAGHYRLAIWGCGSSCAQFAIVDCENGKVHFSKVLPYVSWAGWHEENGGLEFRVDSRLLKLRGSRKEERETQLIIIPGMARN
jgi:hypothetical protein